MRLSFLEWSGIASGMALGAQCEVCGKLSLLNASYTAVPVEHGLRWSECCDEAPVMDGRDLGFGPSYLPRRGLGESHVYSESGLDNYQEPRPARSA